MEELLNIAEKKQKEIQDHMIKRNNMQLAIREITDKVKFIANKKIEIENKIANWQTNGQEQSKERIFLSKHSTNRSRTIT